MNTIKRDVYALRDTIKIPIEVTKGTDMVGFEFAVRDYSIPGTAAAVAYVYHKSMEKPKGILCDINDSTISFTPDNNFFAVGMNELQIRVINNGKSLISFKEKIKCSDAMGFPDDEEESQQTLVEQLLTKLGKEEGDRKTADDTEREERIAADDAEKKARIAEENARAEADEAIRANRIVTLDESDLVTEEGFFVDALAVKELNSKLAKANTKLDNESKNWEPIGTKTDKNRIYIDETKYKEIFCELRLYDQYLQITLPVKYINNIPTNIEKSFCTGGYQSSEYPGVWAELKTGKMSGAAHPYVYFNRGFVNGNAITNNYGICIWGR